MIAVLAAGAVGLLSAFLPFTPAEPYLVAAGATTGTPPVALGVAAAAGQTCGKVLIFLGARRDPLTLAATPAQQTHAPAGDEARAAEGRRRPARRGHRPPRQATAMLLISAVTGLPPLLAAGVYLGRTPMHPAAFAATCLLGRTIRFVTVALAPQLAGVP